MIDKVLKISWSDILKITLIIATIATAWGVQQAKIASLEKGRDENRHNIEILSDRMRMIEIQIGEINSKTNSIYEDVSVIKAYLIGNDGHK